MFSLPKFSVVLESCCKATTPQIFNQSRAFGFKVHGSGKEVGKQYAYRQGKHATSPLIVCHADTVSHRGNKGHAFSWNADRTVATSLALDDRLGIACMFYGIKSKSFLADCSFLICNDEETGQTSAKVFDLPVTPNYMVELDRRGTDVVCYDYDSPLLRSLLRSVGFSVGNGSFSDISSLEHLGVVGFNVGVGYHNEHSEQCFAKVQQTLDQLETLAAFHARFSDIRLDHDPFFGEDEGYWGSKPSKTAWPYTAKVSSHALLDDNPMAWDDEDAYKFGDDDVFYEPKIGKDWKRRIDF